MFKSLNKNIYRLLAVLLAAALCFGFAPAVFAMEGAEETPEIPEESTEVLETESETPKVTSGSCGTNLNWNFSAGTLTISGTGAMTDFREGEMAPWYPLRNEIITLVLPEGMTSVGDVAFYRCKALKSVSIPNSVTEIGWHAFDGCIGITMLNLGTGVQIIEEAAFRECSSVKALKIPGSVKTIGFQAFSWCESLTAISIPASVTTLGGAAFAFCSSLIRAEILAPIEILPSWIFFGCSSLAELLLPPTVNDIGDYALYDCNNLGNVVYNGDEDVADSIFEDVSEGSGSESVYISDSSKEDGGYFSSLTEEDGDIVVKENSSTENSTISSEQTVFIPSEEDNEKSEVEFSDKKVEITIENDKGWDDVITFIEKETSGEGSIFMEIFLKDDSEIPQEVFELLAGKDVIIRVNSISGAVWQFDCSAIIGDKNTSGLLITYSILPVEEKYLSMMGCQIGYEVQFSGDAIVDAEVMIRVPVENATKNATLFTLKGRNAKKIQSVVVDSEGYAHFYLASISKKTVYLIGIDVPGEENNAIIPQNMLAEYGNPEYIEPVKYEITGRTSSWGMNLGQVMSILAAVMVTVIIVVGAVMFFWNRQRLKNGYVPELDEEET